MPARHWRLHAGRMLLAATAAGLLGVLSGRLLEVLLVCCAGYLAWLLYNCFRLYSWLRSGLASPPESMGIWADIFDLIDKLQKRTQDQESQYQTVIQEFQSMADALPDATLVIDPQDNLAWFNDAAHHLLGLRVPGDLGQPVTNLLRDPDLADWMAVEDQVQGHFEMTSPLDSNIRFSVNAVRYREGQRLLVLRDVTEVHNLEKIRRDFVANVSHELRTPLTVLLGYLESVVDQCPEDVVPVIQRMQEQARQMQALLSDLLELSRLQSAGHEQEDQEVDVPAILMQLKEQAEEISQGQHEIRFEIQPNLRLLGNAIDLESAFRNLIINAINYTPAGGRITIRWEGHVDGPCFSVRDTGVGIPKRDIPRLTERFYRVGSDRSRHSGGTGLGLSIVKHVLNTHEARLLIESELGSGSNFRCIFPADRMATQNP